MRWKLSAAFVVLGAISVMPHSHAARDLPGAASHPVTQSQSRSALEVLVFEVDNCNACGTFRDLIVPQYQAGPNATRAPMRFIDLNKVDPDQLALRASISQAPTAVLMRDGKEFDRIAGYVGPSQFMRMLDWMLARAE